MIIWLRHHNDHEARACSAMRLNRSQPDQPHDPGTCNRPGLAMRVRDRLAGVFADEPFADAFGVRGPAGLSPGVLSLVTVLQFAEDLTDRQAAVMAVRAIDWKYALGAELTDTRRSTSNFSATPCHADHQRAAGEGARARMRGRPQCHHDGRSRYAFARRWGAQGLLAELHHRLRGLT